MTMYESASKINEELKKELATTDTATVERLVNLMVRFGAVAKFRCRSNTAYNNFIEATIKDIGSTKRVNVGNFDITQVELNKTTTEPMFKF